MEEYVHSRRWCDTLKMGSREKVWICRSLRISTYWFHAFEGMESWWTDAHICRAISVSLKTECGMVVSQVFSTALNGSVKWPRSGESVMTVKRKDPEIDS